MREISYYVIVIHDIDNQACLKYHKKAPTSSSKDYEIPVDYVEER